MSIDKARLARLAGSSVARYIDFVYGTSRLITEPADVGAFLGAHRPAIIAVWHGQFLLAPRVKPPEVPLRIVLARHGDAEVFAGALARFNTELIRGAGAGARQKDRGGAHALRAALKALEENWFIGLTADVPPGPARHAGEGIVTLARLSGRPIIPLAAATSRYYALPTWSRMTINLPFGKLAGVFGAPIYVPRDVDPETLEAARRAVEEGMRAAMDRAYELAGADPRRATPPPPQAQAPAAPGIGLKTYSAATRVVGAAASLLLEARARRGREDPARRNERFGIADRSRPPGRLVWIHAASVGEINAVLPLADALRRARPGTTFLFTTGTVTSAAIAARRMVPGDIHQYVPLDTPAFVSRFLDHWRPDLAVFTESEIWPNLLLQSAARAIPLALVNARLSNRSFGRWKRALSLSRPLFGRFDIVLAQNEKLARRFTEIGARRAVATGNLKIDAPPPQIDAKAIEQLRLALAGRPVLVAASTHEGEDAIIAEAHRILSRQLPTLCTIIAPRHPERGTAIAELAKQQGCTVAQRSLGALPGPSTAIYVADTMGELGTLYALAPVAFIGGSLVERGGQNPVEAIRHGAAVLTGPHWSNFRDAYQTLLRHRGVVEVHSANELASVAGRLLGDSAEIVRMREGAAAGLRTLSGAIERTVAELLAFLPANEELERAS
jgi:3-deoxy-D-manno-octulosonic-acid transferase